MPKANKSKINISKHKKIENTGFIYEFELLYIYVMLYDKTYT